MSFKDQILYLNQITCFQHRKYIEREMVRYLQFIWFNIGGIHSYWDRVWCSDNLSTLLLMVLYPAMNLQERLIIMLKQSNTTMGRDGGVGRSRCPQNIARI